MPETPTEFLIRMLEGQNIDGKTQMLLVYRDVHGGRGYTSCGGLDHADVIAFAEYAKILATSQLQMAIKGDNEI